MTTRSPLRADVVVVGARCAGAATAMLLARHGHDVLLVDRATFPSDTLSTHAIARSGVVQLHRWGVLDAVVASGAPPIRDVVFHVDGTSTARPVKDRAGVDFVVAPRRHVLDPLMLEAARQAGARVRTGTTVDGVRLDDTGRAAGVRATDGDGAVTIEARFVVGADGLRSRIARSVAAAIRDEQPSHGAVHYAYVAGTWPAIEYFVGDRAFAGIFPTHGGEACVWVCGPGDRALEHRRRAPSLAVAFDAMLEDASPALAEGVRRSPRTSPVRGMVRMPNQVRQAVGAGWALVGDAGYHRDAITGHGISDAFRDAETLAEALDRSLRGACDEGTALAAYERQRDADLRPIYEITSALSLFPPPDRFRDLLRELSRAIDDESQRLASRPLLAGAAHGC